MIVPSKWMVGGRGLDSFRKEMQDDLRLQRIVDYEDASACFPGIHIDGGVCYFLWKNDYKGKCNYSFISNDGSISENKRFLKNDVFDYVIRDNRIQSILEKHPKMASLMNMFQTLNRLA
jgi:hypothetical protein